MSDLALVVGGIASCALACWAAQRWWVGRIVAAMVEFEVKFPGRCGLCSFHRFSLWPPPDDHDCPEARYE
jgi:hypothetical protein